MRILAIASLLLTCTLLGFAQEEKPAVERTVNGQTLTSHSDPAVTITVAPAFKYAGSQAFDIEHIAAAEEHLFVDAAPDKSIRRFYWVQFEHYYPTNNYHHDYSSFKQQPVPLGPLTFQADVHRQKDYFTSDNRPGSDSAATLNLLRSKGYKVDGDFVRVRMVYLSDSARKELMIIYGERIAQQTDQDLVQHAKANLTVR